ncbi:MAG: glycosyltransferase family 2 protein [Prevotella sp.]|nr:glycosyltransferase family 2 protein [Prevotella sp.]
MSSPKVSILIPVYGVEKYIARCARSLFAQTYANIEYIFVDDCSPDNSIGLLYSIIEEFPMRREQMRVVRQDRNRGLGAARRRAMEECVGEYVMHVDSDDCVTENAVAKLVSAALATGADIVDGAYREFSSNDKGDAPVVYPSHLPKERMLKRMLLQNIVGNNIWARLYKRTLYTDNGITQDEGIDYGEDFGIVPRLMLFASRAYIDDVVYLYRNDNSSSYTSRRTPKQDRSLIMANATVYKFFIANDRQGTYTKHLNMGMIAIYRYARQNNLPQHEIDSALGSPITGFAPRLCRMLLGSCVPYRVSDIIYRMLRRMYL